MEPTIFSKIIHGDIPSHKIYEDEKTYAFLDIRPATEGHTLVIPKKPVEFVWELEHDDYEALMSTVQKVALRQKAVFHTPYVGELIVGVDVPHAHVHVIPFHSSDEMRQAFDASRPSADQKALAEVAKKLRFQ